MALHREEEKRGDSRPGVSPKFNPTMSSPIMQNIRQVCKLLCVKTGMLLYDLSNVLKTIITKIMPPVNSQVI